MNSVGPVLSVKDLAHYLQVHKTTIYRLLKAKRLLAFKLGRDWRFNVEAIDRWRIEGERKSHTQTREFQ
jgi:excisionase family DNA binding protein